MSALPITEAQRLASDFTEGVPFHELTLVETSPALDDVKPESIPVTLFEKSWDMACERLCNAEDFGGWIESAGDERQSSVRWGPIGNMELMHIALWGRCTPQETHAAMTTLRRRFIAEHSEQIAREAARMVEEASE